MPWFRVDDGFYSSRKVTQIARADRWPAIGLWTIAGTWSAKELTDGFVPDYQLEELGGRVTDADNLVRVGLWVRVEGGYEFSNWGEYQPTKAEIEAQREKEAERKRKWRESRESQRESRGTDAGRDAGHQAESGHPDPTPPDPARPGPAPDTEARAERARLRALAESAYEAWPRKEKREPSIEKFLLAAKRIDPDLLHAHVLRFAEAYRTHKTRQFTPALVAWLNQGRWTDDLPTADEQRAISRPTQSDKFRDTLALGREVQAELDALGGFELKGIA